MKIKEKRINFGLTQVQLADLIGVTQKDISRWELGSRNPNQASLKKLADIFKCKVDDLLD